MRSTYSNLLQKKSRKSEITNFVDLKWNPKCQASQRALPRPLSRPSLSMISRVSICCASECVLWVCVCVHVLVQPQLDSSELPALIAGHCHVWIFVLHSLVYLLALQLPKAPRSERTQGHQQQQQQKQQQQQRLQQHVRNLFEQHLARVLDGSGHGKRDTTAGQEFWVKQRGGKRVKKATKWGNGIAVSLSCYTNKLILGPDVPNV